MTINEAKNVLRIDLEDTYNDDFINSLLEAIPDYIEQQTGMTKDKQEADPMAQTASGFILKLWYFSDSADDQKLNRTITSLLKCITYKAKESEAETI